MLFLLCYFSELNSSFIELHKGKIGRGENKTFLVGRGRKVLICSTYIHVCTAQTVSQLLSKRVGLHRLQNTTYMEMKFWAIKQYFDEVTEFFRLKIIEPRNYNHIASRGY